MYEQRFDGYMAASISPSTSTGVSRGGDHHAPSNTATHATTMINSGSSDDYHHRNVVEVADAHIPTMRRVASGSNVSRSASVSSQQHTPRQQQQQSSSTAPATASPPKALLAQEAARRELLLMKLRQHEMKQMQQKQQRDDDAVANNDQQQQQQQLSSSSHHVSHNLSNSGAVSSSTDQQYHHHEAGNVGVVQRQQGPTSGGRDDWKQDLRIPPHNQGHPEGPLGGHREEAAPQQQRESRATDSGNSSSSSSSLMASLQTTLGIQGQQFKILDELIGNTRRGGGQQGQDGKTKHELCDELLQLQEAYPNHQTAAQREATTPQHQSSNIVAVQRQSRQLDELLSLQSDALNSLRFAFEGSRHDDDAYLGKLASNALDILNTGNATASSMLAQLTASQPIASPPPKVKNPQPDTSAAAAAAAAEHNDSRQTSFSAPNSRENSSQRSEDHHHHLIQHHPHHPHHGEDVVKMKSTVNTIQDTSAEMIANLRKTIVANDERVSRLVSENARLEEDFLGVKRELEAERENNRVLQRSVVHSSSEDESRMSEIHDLVDTLRAELQKSSIRRSEDEAKLLDLERENQRQHEVTKTLHNSLQAAEDNCRKLADKETGLCEKLYHVEAHNADRQKKLHEEIEKGKELISTLRERIRELEKEQERHFDRAERMEKSRDDTRKELKRKEDEVSGLVAEIKTLKEQMHEAGSPQRRRGEQEDAQGMYAARTRQLEAVVEDLRAEVKFYKQKLAANNSGGSAPYGSSSPGGSMTPRGTTSGGGHVRPLSPSHSARYDGGGAYHSSSNQPQHQQQQYPPMMQPRPQPFSPTKSLQQKPHSSEQSATAAQFDSQHSAGENTTSTTAVDHLQSYQQTQQQHPSTSVNSILRNGEGGRTTSAGGGSTPAAEHNDDHLVDVEEDSRLDMSLRRSTTSAGSAVAMVNNSSSRNNSSTASDTMLPQHQHPQQQRSSGSKPSQEVTFAKDLVVEGSAPGIYNGVASETAGTAAAPTQPRSTINTTHGTPLNVMKVLADAKNLLVEVSNTNNSRKQLPSGTPSGASTPRRASTPTSASPHAVPRQQPAAQHRALPSSLNISQQTPSTPAGAPHQPHSTQGGGGTDAHQRVIAELQEQEQKMMKEAASLTSQEQSVLEKRRVVSSTLLAQRNQLLMKNAPDHEVEALNDQISSVMQKINQASAQIEVNKRSVNAKLDLVRRQLRTALGMVS